MQDENFNDNDDSRGFDDFSCDQPTGSTYDNDKIQKTSYRWRKLKWILMEWNCFLSQSVDMMMALNDLHGISAQCTE